MIFDKIKSHAKINLALNVTGKRSSLHKIESIVTFIDLHDVIYIKRIKSRTHHISFSGKFSKNIGKNNTVSKLLKILDKRKLLQNKKFQIKIIKEIPRKAGLGGGSMNAANILRYFIKKKIIFSKKKEIEKIVSLIGSDVILGLEQKSCIMTSKNKIKRYKNVKKFYTLIVKPDFGCSTKEIYSQVKKFNKPILNSPSRRMFGQNFLIKMINSLEPIALLRYPKLKTLKLFLDKFSDSIVVRMTGSGSALVAYFQSKRGCDNAKKLFSKKYKKYWCIVSKTI